MAAISILAKQIRQRDAPAFRRHFGCADSCVLHTDSDSLPEMKAIIGDRGPCSHEGHFPEQASRPGVSLKRGSTTPLSDVHGDKRHKLVVGSLIALCQSVWAVQG